MANGAKKSRGRPKTFDKDDVLAVAIDAYWKGDPSDVSVNAVCKIAGVSKPGLYREFGGEDGLTLAAVTAYSDGVLKSLFDILASELSFTEKLDASIEFAADDPKFDTGCLFVKMRAAKRRFGPKTQKKIQELEAASIDAFADFLQTSLDRGEWSGGVPIAIGSRYLNEQISLALNQRATGEAQEAIKPMLKMALSSFLN